MTDRSPNPAPPAASTATSAAHSSPSADLSVRQFTGEDGVPLAYRELGAGRPVVLIHGFFSTATVNWIKYGHAAAIAARGFRVIMPDLRGHGSSAKSHRSEDYPPDVLASDGLALIQQLGLSDYDLGGYSLGGRTVLRMMVRGAAPRRAIISGMGLEPMLDTDDRGLFFRNVLTNLGSFERGTLEWESEAFLKTVGGDPQALLNVLNTFVDTPREAIEAIEVPTAVIMGDRDLDHGDGAALAAVLPHARSISVPGNHMSAVARADLGRAFAAFLAE